MIASIRTDVLVIGKDPVRRMALALFAEGTGASCRIGGSGLHVEIEVAQHCPCLLLVASDDGADQRLAAGLQAVRRRPGGPLIAISLGGPPTETSILRTKPPTFDIVLEHPLRLPALAALIRDARRLYRPSGDARPGLRSRPARR